MESKRRGTLYLVGTPIGNLKDITLRALETLREVDLIAAEDTRHTQKLLNHYEIRKPVTSYFEHNKKSKGPRLIEELGQGKNIALVSDAGMPGISDPGCDLVKECIQEQIPVTVIPGPAAVLTALVASGLDSGSFIFAGFFPRVNKERKKILASLAGEKRTIIFYESPYRLCQTLAVIRQVWGERQCCVARELTKVFEEYQRGTLSEVINYYENHPVKGEITILLEGVQTQESEKEKRYTEEDIQEYYTKLLDEGFSKKEALKKTARRLGVPKREIYHLVMIK